MVVSIQNTAKRIQIFATLQVYSAILGRTDRFPSIWKCNIFCKLEIGIFKRKSFFIYFITQIFDIRSCFDKIRGTLCSFSLPWKWCIRDNYRYNIRDNLITVNIEFFPSAFPDKTARILQK